MPRFLACDIGTRRTGVAFGDTDDDIVVALDTLMHDDDRALIDALSGAARQRGVTDLVLGLPLLPGGREGSQTAHAQGIGSTLSAAGFTVTFLDERYSSKGATLGQDGDAKAACDLAQLFLQRRHLT